MLESDYKNFLELKFQSVDWNIQLPEPTEEFFRQGGMSTLLASDARTSLRMRARAPGFLYFEETLPALPRDEDSIAVYTTDFSKEGVGFIAAVQLMPEEIVRILLPSFWLRVRITRCRKQSERCFSVGATLIKQYVRGSEAFDFERHVNSHELATVQECISLIKQ